MRFTSHNHHHHEDTITSRLIRRENALPWLPFLLLRRRNTQATRITLTSTKRPPTVDTDRVTTRGRSALSANTREIARSTSVSGGDPSTYTLWLLGTRVREKQKRGLEGGRKGRKGGREREGEI